MKTPQNLILAEELNDCDTTTSFLLNRLGTRVVGCTTQSIYNLHSVLGLLPTSEERMDFLLEIRAGIRENLEKSQDSSVENAVQFIASRDSLHEKFEKCDMTCDLKAIEVVKKLKSFVGLLHTSGVQALPDQAHMGCLFMHDGRVYLDGTELTSELFCSYLYSSKNNFIWWFHR